jgi:hypothetical protein
MPNIINVSLDTVDGQDVLKIADHGVPRYSIKQAIVWELAGKLTNGDFIDFAWNDPQPPDGIFGTPVVGGHGNSLTVTDVNNSPDSAGEWSYTISVSWNGKTITTKGVVYIDASKDPIIINK